MEDKNLTKKQRRAMKKEEKQAKQLADARKQKSKSIITWLVVLVVLAALTVLVVKSGGNGDEQNLTISEIVQTRAQTAHIKGNPEAQVSIIEYSDFQCPACGFYKSFLDDIVKDLADKVSVEYRHFPLRQIHPNAFLAAQASEAAALQGKFWEMHDRLFDNQAAWSNLSFSQAEDEFIRYAEEIDLDKDKFVQDIDSDIVKDSVKQAEQQAVQIGINSTPTIFVNGLKINNPGNYNEFRKIIESEINWN